MSNVMISLAALWVAFDTNLPDAVYNEISTSSSVKLLTSIVTKSVIGFGYTMKASLRIIVSL